MGMCIGKLYTSPNQSCIDTWAARSLTRLPIDSHAIVQWKHVMRVFKPGDFAVITNTCGPWASQPLISISYQTFPPNGLHEISRTSPTSSSCCSQQHDSNTEMHDFLDSLLLLKEAVEQHDKIMSVTLAKILKSVVSPADTIRMLMPSYTHGIVYRTTVQEQTIQFQNNKGKIPAQFREDSGPITQDL